MALPFWDPVSTTAEGDTLAFDPWDTVFIGGIQLPGVCTVKGLPTLAFDKKKAGGVDGATITVHGYLPGPIDIEILLWTAAQFKEMERIAPLLWRKPNKKTNAKQLAVPISHPAFALWGINAVVILGVSVPEKGPIEGSKVIRFKCVEFVPTEAKSKTKTATAAVPFAPALIDPARNQAGEPPSKTLINPRGKPVSKKGGVS